MTEMKSPQKKASIEKISDQSEFFSPEEKERIKKLVYNFGGDNNLHQESVNKMKNSDNPTFKRRNSLQVNYNTISLLVSHLKDKYQLSYFHFVELFIYFNNFLKDFTINKESFLIANMSFFSNYKTTHTEFNTAIDKRVLKDLYRALESKDGLIHFSKLIIYLKQLAYINDVRINEMILFKLIDKNRKNIISFNDVSLFLNGLHEFVMMSDNSVDVSMNSTVSYIEKNIKKVFRKKNEVNLDEFTKVGSEIVASVESLLSQADEIITKKTNEAVTSARSTYQKFDIPNMENINMINAQYCLENSDQEKENVIETPMDVDRRMFVVASDKNRRLSKLLADESDRQLKQEQTTKYKSDSQLPNMNPRNIQILNAIGKGSTKKLEKIVEEPGDMLSIRYLDKVKLRLLEKIKLNSCLYDITVSQFASEFEQIFLNKSPTVTKQEFVDKILDIVTKYTTKFNIQAKTKSLTDLYEILDCEDQGSVSIYELLGAIIVIVKGTPDEKINALYNFIQTFKANDVILVYSGLINCALNGANGLNSKVFAEVFSEHVSSLNYNSEDFAQWVISSNVIHHEQDISVAQSVFDPRETYEAVTKLLLNNIKAMKDELHVQVRSLNILNALEIFKNNSMLGELNKRQLVTSIEEILSESIVSLQDHDRNEQIAKFVEMLSLDFNNSELFELVQLHPALFVLFEGSAEDKLQSFFQIMGTEDKIDVSDFSLMIRNIFKYAVRNLKVESIDEFVSAFVGEIAESRKTIELNSLIEFYFNIIQEES